MAKAQAAKANVAIAVSVKTVTEAEAAAFKTIADASGHIPLLRSNFLNIPPYEGGPNPGYYPALFSFQSDAGVKGDPLDDLRDAFQVVRSYISSGTNALFHKRGDQVQVIDRTLKDGFHEMWPVDHAGAPKCLLHGFNLSAMAADGFYYLENMELLAAKPALHAVVTAKAGNHAKPSFLGFTALNGMVVSAAVPARGEGWSSDLVLVRRATPQDLKDLKAGGVIARMLAEISANSGRA